MWQYKFCFNNNKTISSSSLVFPPCRGEEASKFPVDSASLSLSLHFSFVVVRRSVVEQTWETTTKRNTLVLPDGG